MKSNLLNTKNIVAFIALILIWGLVIKNKFGLFSNDTNLGVNNSYDVPIIKNNYLKDTFQLVLTGRDPFLNSKIKNSTNHSVKNQTSSNKINAPQKNIKQPIIKNIKWPSIKYYGYVKNKTKGKQACLIKIESNLYQMHKGNIKQNIELVQFYKDSIQVKFNQEFKTILK